MQLRAVLALFLLTLRGDVRSRLTYMVRGALVALILFFIWVVEQESQGRGAVGRNFFGVVMRIDLLVLFVVGLGYFASAITEEKEGETLGLLRMTNLNSLSILLAKSTSRLIGALGVLLAQLPFVLLAVTMGGLTVTQVLAGVASLGAYTFFLANLGLVCSVICQRTARSTFMAAGGIAVVVLIPLLAPHQFVGARNLWEALLLDWARVAPLGRMEEVLRTNFSGPVFGWPCGMPLLLGFLFFGLAWLLFDRYADVAPEGGKVGPARAEKADGAVLALRGGRAAIPALVWKDYHFIAGGGKAVLVKALIVICGLAYEVYIVKHEFHYKEGWLIVSAVGGFFSLGFVAVCLAIDAGRIFKVEREQRTLGSLLLLPMPVARIVRQKTWGCLKASLFPLAALAINGMVFAMSAVEELRGNFDSEFWYGLFVIIDAALVAGMLPMVVAWFSLRMRWGALPVGGVVWFFGNWCAVILLVLMARNGAVVLLPVVAGSVIGMLGYSIVSRIESLSEED